MYVIDMLVSKSFMTCGLEDYRIDKSTREYSRIENYILNN
jgi:hypothetical protein